MTHTDTSPPCPAPLPSIAMAAASGMAVANIYYNQPMLALVQQDLPGASTALLPTVTQLGYALGLILIVPLGDLMERRRLIVVQFLLLAVALALITVAPSPWLLLIAASVVGAAATVAQQIVPLAATLAPADRRGAVVGTVMSGLLCGILLSRTLSGFVSAHWGWRAMFGVAVPIALAGAAMMAARLPRSMPAQTLRYPALIASLADLWSRYPALRSGALTQALLFGSFSVFWSMLALHLQEPRYNLGAATAGLFGVIGVVGVGAAPIAGRVADRYGPRPMIVGGAIIVLLSWVIFALWDSLTGMVAGVILLDFGIQIALISNQHVVYALQPAARARLNTVFMAVMFMGGAGGSFAAAYGWAHAGWGGVALVGLIASGGAAAIQIVALLRPTSQAA